LVKSHWHQEGGDDDEHFTVVLKPERKILVRGGGGNIEIYFEGTIYDSMYWV
jgi:hypothetical protein